MKLRLMALVSGVVLLGALVGGATFALFTDSKSSTATMTSGTLAVEIHNDAGALISGPGGAPLMMAADMAPGDDLEFYGKVHNSGSLPLVYSLGFLRTDAMAAADNALADKLEMRVEYAETLQIPEEWEFALVGDMTIKEWIEAGDSIWLKPLNMGADHRFRITLHLPLETGNTAQGGQNQLTFQANAVQVGTQLAAETTATGSLAAGQSQFYKLWLNAGQTAVASVTSIDLDPDLYTYGVDVQFLGSPYVLGDESATITATAAGYYYVRVHAWPGAGNLNDYEFSWTLQ